MDALRVIPVMTLETALPPGTKLYEYEAVPLNPLPSPMSSAAADAPMTGAVWCASAAAFEAYLETRNRETKGFRFIPKPFQ